MNACPGCGATWSCGYGCPIWGFNGSGWRAISDFDKAKRIELVKQMLSERRIVINHDPGDEDRG